MRCFLFFLLLCGCAHDGRRERGPVIPARLRRFSQPRPDLVRFIVAPVRTNRIGSAESQYYGAALEQALVAVGCRVSEDPSQADFLVYFAYTCQAKEHTDSVIEHGWPASRVVVRQEVKAIHIWTAAVSIYDLHVLLPGANQTPYFQADITAVSEEPYPCTLVIPNMLLRLISGWPGRSGETLDTDLRLSPFDPSKRSD